MVSGAKKTILLLLFYSCCINAIAQQYNFRNYNVQDGLAHSQISSIIQDHKGYLWFSTYGGGLSKFDGKTFTTFSEKEGLSNNIVRPIVEDKKGNLWLGTMGNGVCKFDGEIFTTLKDSSTTINDKIYALMVDKAGTIWFGADNGVYSYDGKKVKHFTEKDGLPEVPVMCIFQDSKGLIWVASWEKGVYCFNANEAESPDKTSLKQFTVKDGLSYHTLMSVTEDTKGNIWLGTFKGATKIVKEAGGWKFSKSFHSDVDSNLVYAVLDDKKGNIWFGTQGKGLIKYDQKKNSYTKINSTRGLPGDIVLCMMQDREGNIWLSNWGMGATEFRDEKFVHYMQKDGLPSDMINGVIGNSKGQLIVNTAKGICSFDPLTNKTELLDKAFAGMAATTVCLDDKGVLWIGKEYELYRYEKGNLKKYSSADGMNAVPVSCINTDKDGKIWIGSWGNGISSFDGKNFVNYPVDQGIPPNVYTTFTDSKGRLCVGSWDEGLAIVDGKSIQRFKKAEGLPSNMVMSILEDKAGNLWLGTFGGGIVRYDGKKFKVISSKDGLSDDAVVAMVLDDDQHLFIAGTKGLNKLDLKEFEKTGNCHFQFYGKAEGFAGIECTRNSAYKDEKGALWFGTKKGLTKYTAAADVPNSVLPQTHLSAIKLFFEDTDWSAFSKSRNAETGLPDALILPYDQNHLTFSFIAASTTVPEKIRFRYKMTGVDKDWSPATDKTEATYSGLAPGVYHFEVIACNNEGLWEMQSLAGFDFTIEPPFWRRTWFYILCFSILIGASVFYTKWQTKKLATENKILEGRVEERTAEVLKQKTELQVAYNQIEEKNEMVEQKNRDITDSINYAQRIQKAILPLDAEIQKSLPQSFVLFKPRDIVSGDFYWFADLVKKGNATSSGSIFACVDCTGHGVPGAFMSMIGNSLLNEIVYEKKIYEPAKILDYLNEGVRLSLKQNQQDNKTHDGMDIALISIDGLELNYAGAHRPLLLIRNGKLEEIVADKFPIGGMPSETERSFTNNKIALMPGDSLYMFTDGFVDQFGGEKGKKFMTRRFKELLLSIQDKTMQEQRMLLDQCIEDWKRNTEQVDDILVIGIKI
ncbi:MAG TPA: two-component regulator propeller domain-containing protein [Bacteroidia bacterium]|jgi:ligand-binding sensor domain-containing protein/serine phosphatase RsbU (regulator of sigma subunit)